MDCFLLIDFGSTNTKITLVDIEDENIVATAKAYTTVETNIITGYNNALKQINAKVHDYRIVKTLACSSAGGGLKIIAIGLVEELTSEGAKRTALGAGAKVIKTYSMKLTSADVDEILNSNADIILLAGGTDGGNKHVIISNAKMLKEGNVKIPVVVGGNKNAVDEIKKIFGNDVEYYIVENVMPKINKLNVENARETIRRIFMKNIVNAKGMQNVQNTIGQIIMPTPSAVLKAVETLSKGTAKEKGIGDLLVVDIGGATTDVHSASLGEPAQKGVIFTGLEEPFIKRTVEGDLGMRYSISSVVEVSGKNKLLNCLPQNFDYNIEEEINIRSQHTDFVASTENAIAFDSAIAKLCCEIAVTRHCGTLKQVYNGENGTILHQSGKDLTLVPYVIGTGGILVHNKNAVEILKSCLYDEIEPNSLKPKNPKFLIDRKYILSAMGLLATEKPDTAIRIMKKYITGSDKNSTDNLHQGTSKKP